MQKSIPTRTVVQIRTHAQKFFLRLSRVTPQGVNEMTFLQSKPAKSFISYFKESGEDVMNCSSDNDDGSVPDAPGNKMDDGVEDLQSAAKDFEKDKDSVHESRNKDTSKRARQNSEEDKAEGGEPMRGHRVVAPVGSFVAERRQQRPKIRPRDGDDNPGEKSSRLEAPQVDQQDSRRRYPGCLISYLECLGLTGTRGSICPTLRKTAPGAYPS